MKKLLIVFGIIYLVASVFYLVKAYSYTVDADGYGDERCIVLSDGKTTSQEFILEKRLKDEQYERETRRYEFDEMTYTRNKRIFDADARAVRK